ncbi:hypothetical protein PTKIN_Ptkin03bG0051200 [Pterospermum kingtungense]
MKKVELIFIPTPVVGHLVSTMEFAKLLIRRDDRIRITILSLKWLQKPPSVDTSKSSASYGYAMTQSYIPPVRNVVRNIVSMKSNSDSSTRVAGLVLDHFCVPMIDVATELDLPAYIYLTSNAAYLGLMFYLPIRHCQNSSEFEISYPEHLIPGFVNLVPSCVLPSPMFDKDGGYIAYVKIAERFMDAKGIMINTFEELEPFAVNCFSSGQYPPIYPVGPVL